MKVLRIAISDPAYPAALRRLADPPPQLFVRGGPLAELLEQPKVAILGSRHMSLYGQQVTTDLARRLAGQGVVIISGLALGVDAAAHEAAVAAGGRALAVLPTPVESVSPISNRRLADTILQQGGALISEYPAGTPPHKLHFVARNRIMAALCDGLLITEAASKSGSLHTAEFAHQLGKEVMVVPGNITSSTSAGTNSLFREGATPVMEAVDVLNTLGLELTTTSVPSSADPAEQAILDVLARGNAGGEQLLQASGLLIQQFSQTLSLLELHGIIQAVGPDQWALC